MSVGKRVAYFDPTADMAGLKYGSIKSIARGVSGTNLPITLTVAPEAGGADVVGAAAFFRVVDDMDGGPNV
jgi:hypothetical protein